VNTFKLVVTDMKDNTTTFEAKIIN
jgi:hypothetical protein